MTENKKYHNCFARDTNKLSLLIKKVSLNGELFSSTYHTYLALGRLSLSYCYNGEPFVPKISIAGDKTQSLVLKISIVSDKNLSLVLKYQSLVIKLDR